MPSQAKPSRQLLKAYVQRRFDAGYAPIQIARDLEWTSISLEQIHDWLGLHEAPAPNPKPKPRVQQPAQAETSNPPRVTRIGPRIYVAGAESEAVAAGIAKRLQAEVQATSAPSVQQPAQAETSNPNPKPSPAAAALASALGAERLYTVRNPADIARVLECEAKRRDASDAE